MRKSTTTSKNKNKSSSRADDSNEDNGTMSVDDEEVDEEEDCNYIFPCNRWLAKGEDDGQIVRELVPYDKTGKFARKNTLTCKPGVFGLPFKAGLHIARSCPTNVRLHH